MVSEPTWPLISSGPRMIGLLKVTGPGGHRLFWVEWTGYLILIERCAS
jgi:hypothetical protein